MRAFDKFSFVLIFSLLFIYSCSTSTTSDSSIGKENKPHASSISDGDSIPSPSRFFVDFATYLDSIGYVPDTFRFEHQVSGKGDGKYQHQTLKCGYQGITIYLLKYSENALYKFVKDSLKMGLKENFIVQAYYFTHKNNKGKIEDGLIEEWSFRSVEEAVRMNFFFSRLRNDVIYPNTEYFCTAIGRYFYIVHTNDSAFRSTNKKVFDRLLYFPSIYKK